MQFCIINLLSFLPYLGGIQKYEFAIFFLMFLIPITGKKEGYIKIVTEINQVCFALEMLQISQHLYVAGTICKMSFSSF